MAGDEGSVITCSKMLNVLASQQPTNNDPWCPNLYFPCLSTHPPKLSDLNSETHHPSCDSGVGLARREGSALCGVYWGCSLQGDSSLPSGPQAKACCIFPSFGCSMVAGCLYLMANGSRAVSKRTNPSFQVPFKPHSSITGQAKSHGQAQVSVEGPPDVSAGPLQTVDVTGPHVWSRDS